ncbi:hypothetical protein DZ860_06475 [Vibrio sinensis]|uniref:Uncharacterized protein n=1 Tax=Vibrio sinensis TaxID=2302434 RepID=A0A3A6QNG0_9VIBR|nr:hypothetical protein [Vibrio sinensis]RJX72798.1 hypothetical protein DZ860_06475 [Vibrio sinensis]
MAAQKLTRERFVQIIIMLTLLIAAFIWRTISYKPEVKVVCDLETICVIDVNGTNSNIEKVGNVLLISKPTNHWDIMIENAKYHISDKPELWQVKFEKIPSELKIIFKSQSDKSDTLKVIVSQNK